MMHYFDAGEKCTYTQYRLTKNSFPSMKKGDVDTVPRMQVGANIKGSNDDNSTYAKASELVRHPNFNDETLEYDYMIAKIGGWVRHTLQSCFIGRDLKTLQYHLSCVFRCKR